jgi:hypothetical protein
LIDCFKNQAGQIYIIQLLQFIINVIIIRSTESLNSFQDDGMNTLSFFQTSVGNSWVVVVKVGVFG